MGYPMSAWGTGLFDNDTSIDVKDYYDDLDPMLSSEDRYRCVLAAFDPDDDHAPHRIDIILPLCYLLWKDNRLTFDARIKLEATISDKSYLDLWDEKRKAIRERTIMKYAKKILYQRSRKSKNILRTQKFSPKTFYLYHHSGVHDLHLYIQHYRKRCYSIVFCRPPDTSRMALEPLQATTLFTDIFGLSIYHFLYDFEDFPTEFTLTEICRYETCPIQGLPDEPSMLVGGYKIFCDIINMYVMQSR
jgi:hypothetical protein